MEKVNIIVGRFQPFTLGHLKCIEEIYKQNGCRTAILIAGSKIDERHPFNEKIIDKMFKTIKREYKHLIVDVFHVKNADIVLNTELLRKNRYEPVSWVCGTDRFQPYNNMVIKYSDKADLTPNFNVFCINRPTDAISATSARNALKMGNYEVFKACVPECINYMYNQFKDCLI